MNRRKCRGSKANASLASWNVGTGASFECLLSTKSEKSQAILKFTSHTLIHTVTFQIEPPYGVIDLGTLHVIRTGVGMQH